VLKRKKIITIIFVTCIIFCSCTKKNVEESIGGNMSMVNVELCGFSELREAERTTAAHALEDITKIMFYEYAYQRQFNEVAIDIHNRRLYTYPVISSTLDRRTPDYEMSIEEIEEVLTILEKYNILNWNETYFDESLTEEEEWEAYTWVLFIQYSDGTVQRFAGMGSYSVSKPENFDAFVEEMINFTHSRVPNN